MDIPKYALYIPEGIPTMAPDRPLAITEDAFERAYQTWRLTLIAEDPAVPPMADLTGSYLLQELRREASASRRR